jgi:hypothetical protein
MVRLLNFPLIYKPHLWCNGWRARLECDRPMIVIVIKRQLSYFQLYHGENKLIFKEMMMTVRFVLEQRG